MMQEFVNSVKQTAKEMINEIHTAVPGKIDSIDYDEGLANVLPIMKRKLRNGEKIDYPLITGVPIVFPQGSLQTASITFPVKPGDFCLLIIAEQALDFWQYEIETETDLPFDITNAICIPGLFQKATKDLQEANEKNSIIARVGEVTFKIEPDGIKLKGDLNVDGKIIATGEVKSGSVSLAQHVHTAPANGGTTSGPR